MVNKKTTLLVRPGNPTSGKTTDTDMDPISVISPIIDLALSIYKKVDKARHFPRSSQHLKERIKRIMPTVQKLADSNVPVPDQARDQRGLKLFSLSLGELRQLLSKIETFLDKLEDMAFIVKLFRNGNIGKKFTEFEEELSIVSDEIQLALDVEQREMTQVATQDTHKKSQDMTEDLKDIRAEFQNQRNDNEEIKQKLDAMLERQERKKLDFGSEDLPSIQEKDLQQRSLIMEGHFCNTYKAQYKHAPVAFKSYNVGQNKELEDILRRESVNLRNLNSPYIVRLWGICNEEAHVLIVFEYMSRGTLRNVLNEVGPDLEALPMQRRIQMALDGALGLYRMHNMDPRPLVHQKISSDIFLVDDTWTVKLSGVGFAQTRTSILKSKRSRNRPLMLNYAAPEKLQDINLPMNSAMDVYSFGIVLYEIASGKKPYEGKSIKDIGDFVRSKGKLAVPDWCCSEFAELINSCRAFDPVARPVANDIVVKLKDICDDAME